jgi:hypothetical protein
MQKKTHNQASYRRKTQEREKSKPREEEQYSQLSLTTHGYLSLEKAESYG